MSAQPTQEGGSLALLTELGRLASEATDLNALLDAALRLICGAMRADSAHVYVLFEGRLVLQHDYQSVRAARPGLEPLPRELPVDGDTLAGRCVLSKQLVSLRVDQWPLRTRGLALDLGVRHAFGAPLLVRGRPVGSVCLFRLDDDPFTPEDRERFEPCVRQLSLGLSHLRLFDAQHRQMEDLRLILDVGQAITRSHDLPEILERGVQSLTRLTDAPLAYLLLINPTTGLLEGARASSEHHAELLRNLRVPVDESSMAGLALRTGVPQQVSDAGTAGGGVVNPQLQQRFGLRGLLSLPLFFGDEPVGAAVIGDDRRARIFTDGEIERAMVMCSQLAIAIANARLFDDLKSSYDALARAQGELVRGERLAALGELAAVVAHEVRNPLGVIYNAMASLRRLQKPEGEAEVLFNFVREEAERLDTIVSDLLDFARPREADLRRLAPDALIAAAVRGVEATCKAARVDLRVEVASSLPPVMADERMMRQALMNLLLNAVQAMPRGGWLAIRAEHEPLNRPPMLRIDIQDSGPGIPPEMAERIFQPFFTTKATGSGLGLAVVRRILDAHHGQVWVDPTQKQGARLCLRLPMGP